MHGDRRLHLRGAASRADPAGGHLRAAAVLAALALATTVALAAHAQQRGDTNAAHEAASFLARIGPRPAASAAELRGHRWIRDRFVAAGLRTRFVRFTVPRRGRSRNVVGVRPGPRRCVKIVMAHADSVPDGPGAVDNASGAGVLVGLAPRLDELRPPCTVWLVATGAEERPYTQTADHLGALALVRHVRRRGIAGRLRYALSLDMVGRGRRFWLRSPRPSPRPGVERDVLAAARRQGVTVRWVRDDGQGNSDHREFELAGLPGMVVQLWRATATDPCYHSACDRARRLDPASLALVQGIAESALGRP